MKILLTGADGFTGVHFTHAAQAAGHHVVPLRADLTDALALREEVAAIEPEAVVHLAGIAFVGHAEDVAFYAVNTVGTATLLRALCALPARPSKVLIASSANVYGNCAASPITEEAPLAPANHYAASKMAMEAIARTYADQLPIVIARPFNYTGVGQSESFLIPKMVSHIARHAPAIELGNIDVEREFNDVAMVCQAYLAMAQHAAPGQIYNVCSGAAYSLRAVMAQLQDITGHAPQIRVNPSFVRPNEVLRLCGHPGKLDDLLLRCGYPTQRIPLRQTLIEMLDDFRAKGLQLS